MRCAPCEVTYADFCPADPFAEDPAAFDAAFDAAAPDLFRDPAQISRAGLCDGCVDIGAGFVTWGQAQTDNVDVMNALDWAVYVFVVVLTTMAVLHEVRDILVCRHLLLSADDSPGLGCRHPILGLVSVLRLFVTLPLLVYAVAQVVFVWGSQPLTMILNALAVLSVVLLNNLAFNVLVGDSTKEEVREFGSARLSSSDARMLGLSRWAYIAAIPAVLIAKLALHNFMRASDFKPQWIQAGGEYPYGLEITFYPFIFGVALETLWHVFVDRRLMAFPGALVRLCGGWLLLNYYMYNLWRYFYKPPF